MVEDIVPRELIWWGNCTRGTNLIVIVLRALVDNSVLSQLNRLPRAL